MSQPNDPIETRLQADAGRVHASDEVPPFDVALDRALARRRTRPVAWLAVAAALLVIAGGATVLARPWHTTPAGGGTRTLRMSDAGFTGAVLDPADPNKLYVLAMTGEGNDPCNLHDPVATAVRQTKASVTVTVSGQITVPASEPTSGYFGFSCASTGYVQVPVVLDAPLGNRTLIDSAGKQKQPVLDPATVPTPSYVPGGYTAEPVTWDPDYGADGTPVTAGKDNAWPALRRYRDGSRVLDVLVAAPQVFGNPRDTRTAPPIDGHAVRVTTDNPTCVLWRESAAREVQVCSGAEPRATNGASTVSQPSSAPLGTSTLLEVARSLR